MPEARRPNLLIITTDQHNPTCFGYAGHPLVRTPNFDALAARGTNFTRAYVANPLCTPSRATMFTGLNTRGHRVRMNGIQLDYDVPTFTEALRQDGYRTHCVGKIHLRSSLIPKGIPLDEADPHEFPEARDMWNSGRIKKLPAPYYGFESTDFQNAHRPRDGWGEFPAWLDREHPNEAHLFHDAVPLEPPSPAIDFYTGSFKWALPSELHPTAWSADRAIDFLDDARAGERPFLLWFSTELPHVPLAPPAPWCYKYDPDDVQPPIFDENEFDLLPPHHRRRYEEQGVQIAPYRSECAAHYYGLIEMIDFQVGRILDALRRNGQEDETVILVTADHGEALGDHGMWGKGPFHYDSVVRVPLLISWPRRFPRGRVHDSVVSLVDFAPTILDIAGVPVPEGHGPPTPVAAEAPPAWPGSSLVPVLEGSGHGKGRALIEDDQDNLGFRVRTLVTSRYRLTAYSGHSYGELFDFQEDPGELRNLWDDPAHEAVRDDLRLALLDEIMDTDPALPRRMVGS